MQPLRVAVFPGTFDPITHGHLDIIERGAALYDELIVAVSENPAKNPLLPVTKRIELIKDLTANWPNVRVDSFVGMTVAFVKSVEAQVILRGIRTFADFEYEMQLALANRKAGGVETVFVMASAENSFVRSTLIKEAVALGGDMSAFVPPSVAKCLQEFAPGGGESSVGLGGQDVPQQGGNGAGLQGEGFE